MIYLVKDSSENYISRVENIIVNDSTSYFKARKLFFLNYSKEKDFEIVISKKSYFNLFLDFQDYPLVSVKEIKSLPETPIELEEYFGSATNIFRILLICKSIDMESLKKLKSKMISRYFEGYPNSIRTNFMELHPDKVLAKLVNCYIFAKYKDYNFNSLIGNEYSDCYNYFRYDEKIAADFLELASELDQYISKSEKFLRENVNKISTFAEFNRNRYFDEISGMLDFEKEFYLKKLIEEMNIIRNFSEIEVSLKNYEMKFNESLEELLSVIGDLKSIFSIKSDNFITYEQWKECFFEKYLPYNSFLHTNIERNIKKIERDFSCSLSELHRSIKNIWKDCRNNFGTFYLDNYNNLQSSLERKGLDYVVTDNKRYFNNGKKNLLIFIDCLRYDIWLNLKKSLEERGFFCQKEETVLSSIPTVTSYCKKILYNGKKFNQIESSNSLLALSDFFSDRKLIKIGSSSDLSAYIGSDDNFLYEILDLDNFFHNFKDLELEMMKSALLAKLDKLLSEIDKEKFNLVVMTDHGAIALESSNIKGIPLKDFLVENELEIENHGRYLKIYSKYYNHNLYLKTKKLLEDIDGNNSFISDNLTVKSYEETDNFYVINRENMNKYYLASVESGKENYFYIIYKDNYFPKNTGDFNHGGISPEEVFIPFAIFNTDKKEYKEVEVEIKNSTLEIGKYSALKLLIKNSNDLSNFKIRLKHQNVADEFIEFTGNRLVELPLTISEGRTGEINEIIEIEFEVMGEKKEKRIPISITIVENRVKEFNKKLKSSRSLL